MINPLMRGSTVLYMNVNFKRMCLSGRGGETALGVLKCLTIVALISLAGVNSLFLSHKSSLKTSYAFISVQSETDRVRDSVRRLVPKLGRKK